MRKQATSKAIKKHMRNGGMNSFDFHPSPRMVRSSQRKRSVISSTAIVLTTYPLNSIMFGSRFLISSNQKSNLLSCQLNNMFLVERK